MPNVRAEKPMPTVCRRVWVAWLTVFGLALGCGGAQVHGSAVAPSSADVYGGALRLTVVNDSRATVCYVHIGPATSTDWGSDWLGPKETIRPGMIRDFGLRNTGLWRVRLVDCRHALLGTRDTVDIAGPTTLRVQRWLDGRE